jgi:hypothetical protein
VCAQERAPSRRSLAPWWEAFGFEDARDRGTCDAMPDVLQRSLNSRVPPPRIIGRHPHHEAPNLLSHARSPLAAARVRPFPGHQLPMAAKNGVGCDKRCEQPVTGGYAEHKMNARLSSHEPAPTQPATRSRIRSCPAVSVMGRRGANVRPPLTESRPHAELFFVRRRRGRQTHWT